MISQNFQKDERKILGFSMQNVIKFEMKLVGYIVEAEGISMFKNK